MGHGTYIGGGTIVGPGYDLKRKPKDAPANKADLEAGQRINDALEARRPKKRSALSKRALAQKKKHVSNKGTQVQKSSKLKEERRRAHEAQVREAREKKRLREERRLQLEAERKADPVYQERLAQKRSARVPKCMSTVVVERRLSSGRRIVQKGLRNPTASRASPLTLHPDE